MFKAVRPILGNEYRHCHKRAFFPALSNRMVTPINLRPYIANGRAPDSAEESYFVVLEAVLPTLGRDYNHRDKRSSFSRA
jgi:hypothetical protein